MPTINQNTVGSLSNETGCVVTSHLERLYHEVVTVDRIKLGVIDIYLDAPDYNLVFDEEEGFTCLDDIARAVVFYCRYYKQNRSENNLLKIEALLSTIFFLQSGNGYFYNFIFPDLRINRTHINSTASPNFWTWRAMWALSEVQLLNNPKLNHIRTTVTVALNQLVENILELIDGKQSLVDYNGIKIPEFVGNIGTDQIALIIASLTNCYQYSAEEKYSNLIKKLGNALLKTQVGSSTSFPYFAFLSWKNLWHAWGNGQACALLYSGMITKNDSFIKAGKKELQHFLPYLISSGFMSSFKVRLVNGELKSFDKEQFPQISYDVRVMVFAALFAFEITEELEFAELAASLVMWLFGSNAANCIMYNSNIGRCYDGIDSPKSVNKNSGAESTIEALLILNEIEKYPIIKQMIAKQINADNYE